MGREGGAEGGEFHLKTQGETKQTRPRYEDFIIFFFFSSPCSFMIFKALGEDEKLEKKKKNSGEFRADVKDPLLKTVASL